MKKIKSRIMVAAALFSVCASLTATKIALAIGTSADVPIGESGSQISNLSSAKDVANRLINQAVLILGAVAVLLIIYAGFLYILPDEKGEGPKKAKSIITYAVTGIIIISIAGFIVKFVLGFF